MTATEHESDIEITKDTPYLCLTSEIRGVNREDLGKNWPPNNGIALYMDMANVNQHDTFSHIWW